MLHKTNQQLIHKIKSLVWVYLGVEMKTRPQSCNPFKMKCGNMEPGLTSFKHPTSQICPGGNICAAFSHNKAERMLEWRHKKPACELHLSTCRERSWHNKSAALQEVVLFCRLHLRLTLWNPRPESFSGNNWLLSSPFNGWLPRDNCIMCGKLGQLINTSRVIITLCLQISTATQRPDQTRMNLQKTKVRI